MKKILCILIIIFSHSFMSSTVMAKCQSFGKSEFAVMENERFGKLAYGMSEKDVMAILGKPIKKEIGQNEVQGKFLVWKYDLGITVGFDANKKPYKIISIKLKSPSSLKTSRSIGLGSSLSDVKREYACVEDKENSNPNAFIAGSLYGGVSFDMVKGKVNSIFLGAMAE